MEGMTEEGTEFSKTNAKMWCNNGSSMVTQIGRQIHTVTGHRATHLSPFHNLFR